jgi:transcriptional regulator with XRE-family HTH domain
MNIFFDMPHERDSSLNKEIGEIVSEIRAEAGLTQKQLADKMNRNQTGISRLESGDGDAADVSAYLRSIGTRRARAFADVLKVEWRQLPRPSLRHPNLEILIAIEGALARVREFRNGDQVSALLASQAELLERRLEDQGRYLLALNHDVVYVGEIGVGKTTALCRQVGLAVDPLAASDLKGMLLDTGGGRTTLCEVRVEAGERFAITVEPLPDEEIYKLVGEVCRGIRDKLTAEASASAMEFRPAEEVERALRNMAGLPRSSRQRKGGAASVDPAADLARACASLDDFSAEFAARLGLWRRRRRAIEFDGADVKAGRQWLKSNFRDINHGRHAGFSLPASIVVTVPFVLTSVGRLPIAVVDTRGVDDTAIRPDILRHLKDERAVTLLCSRWGSAPDVSMQRLLVHLRETEADRSLLSRVGIVVLARPGEAMSMRDDSGESAEDVDGGYAIKRDHVEDALQKMGLRNIAIFAFDASSDDTARLTTFIDERLTAIRTNQVLSARSTIAAIDQMLEDREKAQALAAFEKVAEGLEQFAERCATLGGARRAAHERLLGAVVALHARTVWATTRRNGRFWNFDVFQYLGDGAAAEAKVRSSDVIGRLTERAQTYLDDDELASTHRFLGEILANAGQWEADFVNAARHHAVAIYQEPLDKAQDVWDVCEAPYGTGMVNYREHVASQLRTWFEENVGLREELERRIGRAWEGSVIAPLLRAAGLRDLVGVDSPNERAA